MLLAPLHLKRELPILCQRQTVWPDMSKIGRFGKIIKFVNFLEDLHNVLENIEPTLAKLLLGK